MLCPHAERENQFLTVDSPVYNRDHTFVAVCMERSSPIGELCGWVSVDPWVAAPTLRTGFNHQVPHTAICKPPGFTVLQAGAPCQMDLTHCGQPSAQNSAPSHGVGQSEIPWSRDQEHFTWRGIANAYWHILTVQSRIVWFVPFYVFITLLKWHFVACIVERP